MSDALGGRLRLRCSSCGGVENFDTTLAFEPRGLEAAIDLALRYGYRIDLLREEILCRYCARLAAAGGLTESILDKFVAEAFGKCPSSPRRGRAEEEVEAVQWGLIKSKF